MSSTQSGAAHDRPLLDGLDLADGDLLPDDSRAARPGGHPRNGILGFETTRGDRLFVSLLGSAFICLGWLGFTELSLWWALALSLAYAIGVFRLV